MYNIKYMCLAIPGKVKSVNGMKITVEYPHETRQVLSGGIEIKKGDYVLVQMGVVIKKIDSKEHETASNSW